MKIHSSQSERRWNQRGAWHVRTSLPLFSIEFLTDGRFRIKDVTPGSYVVWAGGTDAGKCLLGRAALTISDQEVDNLELIITGESPWGDISGSKAMAGHGGQPHCA